MRGKPTRYSRSGGLTRLIPACAGKTPVLFDFVVLSTAHPRVCGENVPGEVTDLSAAGSSPRVRGKPRPQHRAGHRPGLIPACAGKTRAMGRDRRSDQAHPRVCGENSTVYTPVSRAAGSSPRVRGKPGVLEEEAALLGLIPACAGKTAVWAADRSPGSAHPRVCGENLRVRSKITGEWGSSPRVRGKLPRAPRHRLHPRLIPACAGKTQAWSAARSLSAAHPRVCGENPARAGAAPGSTGSSPRVRGKRPRHQCW